MQPESSSPGVLRTHSRVTFLGDMEDPVVRLSHSSSKQHTDEIDWISTRLYHGLLPPHSSFWAYTSINCQCWFEKGGYWWKAIEWKGWEIILRIKGWRDGRCFGICCGLGTGHLDILVDLVIEEMSRKNAFLYMSHDRVLLWIVKQISFWRVASLDSSV